VKPSRTCILWVALGVTALAGGATLSRAAADREVTVDEIVSRANHVAYYQGGTGRATVKLTIYDAGGNVRGTREMVILRRNANADENKKDSLDQKLYAYFRRPPDVRNTVFLVWKKTAEDAEDDRWLYSPGLDLTSRIAAGDKRTSFVGSHFFYEDVSGRGITEDKHELLRTTKDYYILRNTPKDADQVEFAHYDMYVHRTTFMPLHAYYYDKSGTKYREFHVLGMKEIQGFWTATKTQMLDLREKGKKVAGTVAEYSDVRYSIELPEDIFTERYLRKAPREYLQ